MYKLLLLLLLLCVEGVHVDAQVSQYDVLAEALRKVVSVSTPRGPLPVRHCREAPLSTSAPIPAAVASGRGHLNAWHRCDQRLKEFARYFIRGAKIHGVDPYILAAMARVESGLNPFATGAIGEGGIAQLHPRGIGRRSRFVSDEQYRRSCMRETGACQGEVVELQAEHLRAWMDRCGSLDAALGGYNRGRCGETAYTRNVHRVKARLSPQSEGSS